MSLGFGSRVDSPCTSKNHYGTVEEMNKNKAQRLWMDPTLFIIYGQEKCKHYLRMKLFTLEKIAIRIHDLEDCGMSRGGFEMCSTSIRQFFM
jgi:hypothetical protein